MQYDFLLAIFLTQLYFLVTFPQFLCAIFWVTLTVSSRGNLFLLFFVNAAIQPNNSVQYISNWFLRLFEIYSCYKCCPSEDSIIQELPTCWNQWNRISSSLTAILSSTVPQYFGGSDSVRVSELSLYPSCRMFTLTHGQIRWSHADSYLWAHD